ncbi:MAG: hypothetical protein GX801_11430 [Fibrobacter sp.]|nr:hypothetical protein [Fibrobacter sp.]
MKIFLDEVREGKNPLSATTPPQSIATRTSAARSPPPLMRGHPATPREPGGNPLINKRKCFKKLMEKLN